MDDNTWATAGKLSGSQIAHLPFPFDSNLGSSIKKFGGVKVGIMSLKLTVEGQRSRSVLITGMSARILSKASPPAGTLLCVPPQGVVDDVIVGLNLDSPNSPAGAISAEGGNGEPFFKGKHVELTQGEKQIFQIYASARKARIYTWDLMVDLVVDGKIEHQIARVDGNPIVLSGFSSTYSAKYGPAIDTAYDLQGRPTGVIGSGWQLYPLNPIFC